MKQKVIAILLLVATSSMVFDSCKKKDKDEETTPSTGMNAKINGVSWRAEPAAVTATIINNLIEITGIETSGKTIAISVKGSAAGTYVISGPAGNTITFTNAAGDDYTSDFNPTAGSFQITSLDATKKTMSGKFSFGAYSFSASDSVVVTEGTFTNIAYTTTAAGGGNTLTCKIDGVDFIGTTIHVTDNVTAFQAIEMDVTTAAGSFPDLHLIIPDTEAPGTYDMAQTANDAFYYPASGLSSMEQTGQIIITVHNTTSRHIEGTFNFTAQNINGTGPVYTATNGVFTANY
jgi:hypothetical protein